MVQHATGRKLDTEKAIEWLKGHWKDDQGCPICGNTSWGVSDELVEIRPFKGGGMALGGSVYPLFAATCNTCGHTLLFNAVVAGLLKEQE
jgi:hypothetical protein